MQIKQNRDLYFDFLKGVLILLVLVGHGIQYSNGNEYLTQGGYWTSPVMMAIYSFHMPLFSLISGYFQCGRAESKNGLARCFKRLRKLGTPIALWAVILFLCKMLIRGELPSVKSAIYSMVNDYWFLWAMMLGACLIFVVAGIKRLRYRILVYGLVVAAFLLTPDVFWVGAAFKYVVPFYALGYELARAGWQPKNTPLAASILWLASWILLMFFFDRDSYIYTSLFSLADAEKPLRQLAIDVYRNAVAVAGCFAHFGLLHWVWERICGADGVIKKCLLIMGQHSLAIYILSTPIYMYVVPEITYGCSPSVLITASVVLATSAVCVALTALLGKNKLLSGLLLGE